MKQTGIRDEGFERNEQGAELSVGKKDYLCQVGCLRKWWLCEALKLGEELKGATKRRGKKASKQGVTRTYKRL